MGLQFRGAFTAVQLHMKTIANLLFITIASVLAGRIATAADLPRYKFAPGLEMVYAGSSDFNFSHGAFHNSDTTAFWVTGQNKDGSWHLVYLGKEQEGRTGDFASTNDTTTFGHLDLFPDGHSVEKSAKDIGQRRYPAFLPLPADSSQVKFGWAFAESEAVSTSYRVKQAGNPWIIAASQQGIFHDIYQMGASNTIYFNADLGFVEKIEQWNEQGYGFTGQGTGTVELKSHTIRDPDWTARLAADAGAVGQAKAVADEADESVSSGATTNAGSAEATARQALQSALGRIQNDSLREVVNSDLANLDERFNYARQEHDRTDSVLNKPAASWTTTDLAGQKHSLEDYRGQVVALDFWYRGCGWCMRAMPQVKALADQFHGQPVVILGMNTDQKDANAQFVVDKLQLNYLTLHGTGIPEKYGVQGFPTFILIDQKGIVRARHVGYSPTLHDEMAKTITSLLAESK
jgi:thiol-disulfide isomerase/thioredoxin